MTYAEMDRIRKRARAFYLELRALDLEPYAVEDEEEPIGYGVRVSGLASLSERHKDRILRRVEENKPGLVWLLLSEWEPDLLTVRQEGSRGSD